MEYRNKQQQSFAKVESTRPKHELEGRQGITYDECMRCGRPKISNCRRVCRNCNQKES